MTDKKDERNYFSYPGSESFFDVESFTWQRNGDKVVLEWRNHSDEYKEERAKFLNKLVADRWEFVSILSEIPDNGSDCILTIVISR